MIPRALARLHCTLLHDAQIAFYSQRKLALSNRSRLGIGSHSNGYHIGYRACYAMEIERSSIRTKHRQSNRTLRQVEEGLGGAEHWAVIASPIETCKLIGVEPYAYMADVITKIVNGHPISRLDQLLPGTYPATPTSIQWPQHIAYVSSGGLSRPG